MAHLIEVSEATDPRLAEYQSLTDVALRRIQEPEWGIFLAESAKVIGRALRAGYAPRSALTSAKWLPHVHELLQAHDVPVYVGSDELLLQVTGYRVHRGALAAMERRVLPAVEDVVSGARRLAILEGIVDHTNVGAAFRSIAALGFDGVLIDPTCADPLYRRSVRVSMGTVFTVPWTRTLTWPETLDDVRNRGFVLVAMTPDASVDIAEVATRPPERLAILIGTEGAGLSQQALGRVDVRVAIPMRAGVDSLNLAAATAVACYVLRLPD